jgi:ABC-type nitrate/sulfonate/bicarbonate transport system permease component
MPLARTLLLLVLGYAIACPIGIGIGLLMGRIRRVHDLLEPALEMLRPLPKIAILPLLALFVGFGTPLKLTMVVLGVVFPVLINTIQGVRGVERTMVDMARVFGHSRPGILWFVILPAAMPMILAGMRVGLAFALILVLLAEMLAGSGGLGTLIIETQRSFRVLDMYVWLLLVALLGYALNALFVRIEHRLAAW